ncbi:MAG TPA: hypothetical protein DCR04_02640, partial [Flavobacteriales bacterium]|nr:hypothetical protein [Flavobacteriales bacterium]
FWNTDRLTPSNLGPINFQDFDLAYRDEIIGLEADLQLHDLELEVRSLDSEQLIFSVNVMGKAIK